MRYQDEGEVFCAAIGCNPCDYISYPDLWPENQPPPSDQELANCYAAPSTTTTIGVEPVFIQPLPRTGVSFLAGCYIVAAILLVLGWYLVRKSQK